MSIPFLIHIYSPEGFLRFVTWADSYEDAHQQAAGKYELDDIDDIEEFSTFEHGDTRQYPEL